MPASNLRRLVMIALVLPLTTLLLSSCTSYFKRKECEKTDWFEFGRSVAMGGNRLSGNSYVNECERVEAEINHTALSQGFKKGMATYCLPETVSALGKRGEFFSADMCDGDNTRLLKQRHAEGVTTYCQKSNGQAAGAVGKPYNQICPKELEASFLPEFNKGRKKFLAASIHQMENEIDDVEREIRTLESRRRSLTTDLSSVGDGKIIKREMKYDPISRTTREEISMQEDPQAQARRKSISDDIRSVDRQIDQKRDKQSDLRKKIRDLNQEILTL